MKADLGARGEPQPERLEEDSRRTGRCPSSAPAATRLPALRWCRCRRRETATAAAAVARENRSARNNRVETLSQRRLDQHEGGAPDEGVASRAASAALAAVHWSSLASARWRRLAAQQQQQGQEDAFQAQVAAFRPEPFLRWYGRRRPLRRRRWRWPECPARAECWRRWRSNPGASGCPGARPRRAA